MAKERKPLTAGAAQAGDDAGTQTPSADEKTTEVTEAPAPETPEEMEARIRLEVEEKHRAEVAARLDREQAAKDAADAENGDLVSVKCVVSNVHTSKGKIVKGQSKSVPEGEADQLEASGQVKRA